MNEQLPEKDTREVMDEAIKELEEQTPEETKEEETPAYEIPEEHLNVTPEEALESWKRAEKNKAE